MKRYYIVITPFFPEPDSFRGSYVYDQIKAIERNSDFKVIVLKPIPFYHKGDDYEYNGVKVYRFVDYNLPSNVWPNNLTDYLSIKSMFRTLDKIGVDIADVAVAHSHVTRFGIYANALKKHNPDIISIVQHHGFDVMTLTDGRFANFTFHKRHCVKYGVNICNKVDLNVGVSKKTLEYVEATPGVKLNREYVLYNGVDTSVFYPISNAQKPKEVFTIGCVANFWELKDQMTLIRAVERLVNNSRQKIKVLFVGTGYTRQQCEDYITVRNLTEYFEFRDEVDHSLLPDFYRGLDLFVLPSYWEAFGCVYTEAYACGVPFIGVKGQGIAEIVSADCQNRWLIEKGDYIRLSELIKCCIKAPKDKPELAMSVDINELMKSFLKRIGQ